jgi:hypothetical protein
MQPARSDARLSGTLYPALPKPPIPVLGKIAGLVALTAVGVVLCAATIAASFALVVISLF